ncbi:hypothetical protein EVAR_79172_1 [Eumeta japonica]|uniref:Uncharacterized protein n=1 Tax=Eumeta variegata TaxID=151549 RepID=A0A4C1UT28_EUMVA|nr:hypothetical protein EVAR_79172_1 [Eumeta japonica]
MNLKIQNVPHSLNKTMADSVIGRKKAERISSMLVRAESRAKASHNIKIIETLDQHPGSMSQNFSAVPARAADERHHQSRSTTGTDGLNPLGLGSHCIRVRRVRSEQKDLVKYETVCDTSHQISCNCCTPYALRTRAVLRGTSRAARLPYTESTSHALHLVTARPKLGRTTPSEGFRSCHSKSAPGDTQASHATACRYSRSLAVGIYDPQLNSGTCSVRTHANPRANKEPY